MDMRRRWAGLYEGPAPVFVRDETDRTYELAAEWLDRPGWYVEDWGGGRGRAGQFFQLARYQVIDGSVSESTQYPGRDVPIIADLQDYLSVADGILLRHVLEHNYNWRSILDNALRSALRRLALVIFTPWAEGPTRQIATNWAEIPDLSFNKAELLAPASAWSVNEETCATPTQYRTETVLYLERRTFDG